MYDVFHFCYLKAVYYEIDEFLRRVGKASFCVDYCSSAAKGFRERRANFFCVGSYDHSGFGTPEAVYDIINGFQCGGIGYDGVERENPAVDDEAAYNI